MKNKSKTKVYVKNYELKIYNLDIYLYICLPAI
jgi:hypothetical protein